MFSKLTIEDELFKKLIQSPPVWWENIVNDNELYIDIRKDNYLNVYCNGGALIKLEWKKNAYKGSISQKYIPIESEKEYVNFMTDDKGNISLAPQKVIEINNFNMNTLKRLKSQIKLYYPDDSEKGIQGQYVRSNRPSENAKEYFIDTEFEKGDVRIDMVWLDTNQKRIYFVELKTIGDQRLNCDCDDQKSIKKQLTDYNKFAQKYKADIIKHYNEVYKIKKKLRIIRTENDEEDIEKYELIEKPILVIADCNRKWISYYKENYEKNISEVASACIYRGLGTKTFTTCLANSPHIKIFEEKSFKMKK